VGYQHTNGSSSNSITSSYTTGNISGVETVGGLVGYQNISNGSNNTTENCYATGNVIGDSRVGGLVGNQYAFDGSNNTIENCYATGNIMGSGYSTGGLVGGQSAYGGSSSITNCYATGNVTATGNYGYVGGLVGGQPNNTGINSTISITNCYATGAVSGNFCVGGLIGLQSSSGAGSNSTISNCYAAGNVTANYDTGGMVGEQRVYTSGVSIITNSYRYVNLTLNGSVIPAVSNDINGVHGGVKSAAEFMSKTTYTINSWLFNDSTPTAGPWHWDGRGFPKLNMGTEDWPFPWGPLVIIPIITIHVQPAASTTVAAGSISGDLTISASVTGNGEISYQWHSNTTNSSTGGTPIPGAYSASFAIPKSLTEGTYYYYCVLGAVDAGYKTSDVARVIVTPGPTIEPPKITINTQPQATTTVIEGSISGSLSISASVTGNGEVFYQWYFNTTNSNTGGGPISGAVLNSFTIPAYLTEGTYYYYCIVGAIDAIPVTSNVARVIVNDGSGDCCGNSSGCNAVGYGFNLALALFGAVLFVQSKRK
jgi:hypothetical protein